MANSSILSYILQILWDVADIDARTAGLLAAVLQPFLSIGILLMIIRIVLSWYPQVSMLSSPSAHLQHV